MTTFLFESINGSLSKEKCFLFSIQKVFDYLFRLSSYRVDTSLGGFLGVMLTYFNNTQVLPKNARQSQVAGNQKTDAE
jgi:hypothetical protein